MDNAFYGDIEMKAQPTIDIRKVWVLLFYLLVVPRKIRKDRILPPSCQKLFE